MAKILVVEDDSSIRTILKYTFDGHEVTLAVDGLEALSLIETQKDLPDLIVMDIMMPHLDGITASRMISAKHSIPTIFVSAAADQMDIPVSLSHAAVVLKPFDPLALRNVVDRYLENSAAPAACYV